LSQAKQNRIVASARPPLQIDMARKNQRHVAFSS
jgi:hypothetical protein